MKYTGRNNEKATAWAEEERPNADTIAGGCGEIGSQGQSAWRQQKRTSGAISKRSSILSSGAATTGGMIDHLIEEYRTQVTAKREEEQRIKEEILRLDYKIREFEALKEELKKQVEDNS